jgi:hypothetical protein
MEDVLSILNKKTLSFIFHVLTFDWLGFNLIRYGPPYRGLFLNFRHTNDQKT